MLNANRRKTNKFNRLIVAETFHSALSSPVAVT